MQKKLFLLATAAIVFTPAVTTTVEASPMGFKDVSKNSPYYDIINEMAEQEIISGYEDGTFKPNELITRKHAVALLSRVPGVTLKQTVPAKRFKDITPKNPNYKFYHDVQKAGIVQPNQDGNFNPNEVITRAEMASMLINAFGMKGEIVDVFVDTPYSRDSFWWEIQELYSLGITTGDNGKFYPDKNLTRAHFATFMHRTINRDPDFIAQPIKKERKIRNSGHKYTDTGLYTDYYNEIYDVPLPDGETYQSLVSKQEKEFIRLRVKNKTNTNGRLLILRGNMDNGNLIRTLEAWSKRHQIPYDEFVASINKSIETGEVFDGGYYTFYYNFQNGGLYNAFDRYATPNVE